MEILIRDASPSPEAGEGRKAGKGPGTALTDTAVQPEPKAFFFLAYIILRPGKSDFSSTAATVAKYGNVPAVAAFDSGNLLAIANALHQRWPDKRIMIAGDDDHKLENNPGRVKALEASLAVHGMVVFLNLTAEQREKGLTDFNDLALENPRLAGHQLEDAVWRAQQREAR